MTGLLDSGAAEAFWRVSGFALHLAGAAACVLAIVWLWRKRRADRARIQVLVSALGLTALWSFVALGLGPFSHAAIAAESLRNLGWLAVLYRFFAVDGRHRSLWPIRPVIAALALVEVLHSGLIAADVLLASSRELAETIFYTHALFRVLGAVGALVLLHNFWLGARPATRMAERWSATALAVLWIFDLNLYAIAWLADAVPDGLAAIRGLVTVGMALALALGTAEGQAQLRIRPSRTVAFRSLSLLLISAYLLVMVAVARAIATFGADFAHMAQAGFLLAAVVMAILWLPSTRFRGWLRVTLVKHLFQHRYDYRQEWLRFTETMRATNGTDGGGGMQDLHRRAVKAVADITESPAGLLLPIGQGAREAAAAPVGWNWPGLPAAGDQPIPAQLALLMQRHRLIVDLDAVRDGRDCHGEAALVPDWLATDKRAWIMVPLLHFDSLLGVVVLSRPGTSRALDWEDFDLLRIVGQQLASYLAEQEGQHALSEAARFDEFNRRIAFVIHDIKNLASQLALLAGNAERHADKPEFRADMLVTLRNSADKLNALLARLVRYNATPEAARAPVSLGDVARSVAGRFAGAAAVEATVQERASVLADGEGLEQAVLHLVQNAIDASDEGSPVMLEIGSDGVSGILRVIDSGSGMDPAFVRDDLFRPFVSTRNGGFGIGAFEARELIRAMGGELDVDSRVGLGTRFTITLPLVETAALHERRAGPALKKVA